MKDIHLVMIGNHIKVMSMVHVLHTDLILFYLMKIIVGQNIPSYFILLQYKIATDGMMDL